MVRFVDLGQLVINAERISSIIEKYEDERHRAVIITKDGQRIQSYTNYEDLMVGLTSQIIPAQPGYYFISRDEDGTIWKEPIVAWRIDDQGYCYGLSCDGQKAQNQFILDPLGQVINQCDRIWRSVNEWLKDETI